MRNFLIEKLGSMKRTAFWVAGWQGDTKTKKGA